MISHRSRAVLAISIFITSACAGEGEPNDEIEGLSQALNACEETVPATRYIDGFPAYAQCSAFQSGAIYSNNGIDTSGSKVGSDWIQTQPSGGYQCTELVHRYWLFKWNVSWLPRGNAGSWCDTQPPASSGVVQTMTPVHGDAMVLAPGSCGAAAGTGHVALVDVLDSTGRVVAVEQNQARRGTYQQSCAKCFLHLVANDGSPDAGVARPAPVDAGSTRPRGDAGAPERDAGPAPVDAASAPLDSSAPSEPTSDASAQTSAPLVDAGGSDAASSSSVLDSGATSDDAEESEAEGGCSIGHTERTPSFAWSLLLIAAAARFRRSPGSRRRNLLRARRG